jgi:hypothetical protein
LEVLDAIDLSSVGGLNYNGIETLLQVENLNRNERGVLPSRSSVQKVAYELHEVGQRHIPLQKKRLDLGEMYQVDFEKCLCFF